MFSSVCVCAFCVSVCLPVCVCVSVCLHMCMTACVCMHACTCAHATVQKLGSRTAAVDCIAEDDSEQGPRTASDDFPFPSNGS